MSPVLSLLAVVFALTGAAVAWTFVSVYAKPPFVWRTYEAGRHLMRFTFALAVILTWSLIAFVLRYVTDDADWVLTMIEYGRVIVFGWIAYLLAGRLRLLLAARKAGTHHAHDEAPPADQERRELDTDDAL